MFFNVDRPSSFMQCVEYLDDIQKTVSGLNDDMYSLLPSIVTT